MEAHGGWRLKTSISNLAKLAFAPIPSYHTRCPLMDRTVLGASAMSHSVTIKSISLAAAERLATTALAHGEKSGWKLAIAITDPSGALIAFRRMDGVSPVTGEIALDKAYTSATLRRSTKALAERMTSSADLPMGMANRPRLMAWQGGLPIIENGMVIGGIGISGAAGFEDAECGEVALASLGLTSV